MEITSPSRDVANEGIFSSLQLFIPPDNRNSSEASNLHKTILGSLMKIQLDTPTLKIQDPSFPLTASTCFY